MTVAIKCIRGDEPKRNDEYPVLYHVGYDGITSITESTENLGEYGIHWFHVWRGSIEAARMNARYVADIIFDERPS